MAESVVGDITPHDGVSKGKQEKYKLEDFGFRYIESLLKPFNENLGREVRNAWLEFERAETKEAQYMHEMDKLECMIQAHEYEQRTHGRKDLEEFQGLSSKVTSAEGVSWLGLLQQERQSHLSKRRQRIPVIFVIGATGVGKRTQCTLLFEEFGFQHISLGDVLRERSNDHTYPHADFLENCLDESVKIPTGLSISLLEKSITKGMKDGKRWILMRGFPESTEELHEFEDKVQKPNYTLLLSCTAEKMLMRSASACSDLDMERRLRAFTAQSVEIENRLKAVQGYYKNIDGDGSIEEVFGSVKKAVVEFIQHAEVEKKGDKEGKEAASTAKRQGC
ncbi:hypothetical protein OEA41_006757 [Lepraria neglecta]|uniref:HD domain-containing protein n=1 Tax=Lepraria neglecta TaxID=209136 RepID=A0AAE0DNC7_9LECA|nr:hypothetical protein OEA41_006757 [Lepraria neglecta]